MSCTGSANCEATRRHRVTVQTRRRPTTWRDLHKLRLLFLRLVFIPRRLVWMLLLRLLRYRSRKLLMRSGRVYRLRCRRRRWHRLRSVLHIRIDLGVLVHARIRISRRGRCIASITSRGSTIMRRRITRTRRILGRQASILQRGIDRRWYSTRASGIGRGHGERAGHSSRTSRLRGRRHEPRAFAFRHGGPVNRRGRVSRRNGHELRGVSIAIPVRTRIARMGTRRITVCQIVVGVGVMMIHATAAVWRGLSSMRPRRSRSRTALLVRVFIAVIATSSCALCVATSRLRVRV